MSLQPEVLILQAEPKDLALAELIFIVSNEFGTDPVESVRDAVALLNGSTDPTFSDSGTRIISEFIWLAYGDQLPCDGQLCKLEETVGLMLE